MLIFVLVLARDIDRASVKINMGVFFFLGKCVRTGAKTVVVNRRNQKPLALLRLASETPLNAANSSDINLDAVLVWWTRLGLSSVGSSELRANELHEQYAVPVSSSH